ncbi:MAG: sulfatase family protein [Solirubrobacterales bacterium]
MAGGIRSRVRSTWALALVALVAVLALALATAGASAPAASNAPSSAKRASDHPNVVFVLTDDLSWNLLKYMPNVKALQSQGETFSRYYVTDSLCCPSRSSIFTGRVPHNTGVITNKPPNGGFQVFHDRGEESDTFATAISSIAGANYRTAMMGKYLNGYEPSTLYVPPGWSEWDVAGNGYKGFDYQLNENGSLVSYGSTPADYLTDVLAGKGVNFINGAAQAGNPFMLEIATFAPHAPSTPAPRDAQDFPNAKVPRTPAFNTANTNPPSWLAGRAALNQTEINNLDERFRKRAQSVQAVDDMIGRLRATLSANGVANNTYLVFSSDNGYHMGDHRLMQGKMTAFDTDISVPLVVVGPDVPAGKTVDKITENVDLRSTFSQLAGASVPNDVDGHSLVPLLHNANHGKWRTAALVEHHGPDTAKSDPDYQTAKSGNPTTYEAIRRQNDVYVEYANGDREYYNVAKDPYERHNTYGALGPVKQARLHQTLTQLETCSGQSCWVTGS